MSVYDASRIITDESRVMLQIVASLTDNSRGVNYDCNKVRAYVSGLTPSSQRAGSLVGLWISHIAKRSEHSSRTKWLRAVSGIFLFGMISFGESSARQQNTLDLSETCCCN